MSSEIQTDNSATPQPRIFLSTAITLAICIGAVLVVAYLQRDVFDQTQRLFGANQKKVDAITSELSETNRRSEQIESNLAALQKQLESGTLTNKDLETLLNRLKQLEDSGAQQAGELKLLSEQASAAEGDRARNRVQILEAVSLGQGVEGELTKLEQSITAWKGINASLEKGDVGRRIASMPELVAQYATLSETELATFEDHDRWNKQFSVVYSRIKAANDNKEFIVVTQDDLDLLATLLEKAKTAQTHLQAHIRSLNILIATVQNVEPGTTDLSKALTDRQSKRDQDRLRQMAKAKAAAAEEVDAKYAQQLADEERAQRELANEKRLQEAKLKTEQGQKDLDGAVAAVQEAQQEKRKKALLREFQRDQRVIQSLLSPFLDFAITQPSGTNPITKGGNPRPTSLGALKGFGALNNNRAGLDALYHAGGHPANLRKKGGFPSFTSMTPIRSESVRQTVRRAQDLLIKYGDILVEKGMLSP